MTIEEVVGRVSLWRGVPVSVSPLSGGLTNENYLVQADGDRYVVRIPGQSTELLAVDRANEIHNTKVAASTGVGPRVLEHLPDIDVMVLEFIPGATMTGEALRAPGMAARMAGSLRRLHAGPRFLLDFDMFRVTEYYLRIVDRHGVRIPQGYRDRLDTVTEIERALAVHTLPTVPAHNDLLAENYIDDGALLRVVDYEYSGNGDPCFELGNTAQECSFGPDLREALCRAYFGRADPVLLARMNLFALMSDVGWTLWGAIQARVSAIDYDFWGYASDRWDRAVSVLDSEAFRRWLKEAATA